MFKNAIIQVLGLSLKFQVARLTMQVDRESIN